MRLSFDIPEHGQVAHVTLSRRNLLALLHKLDVDFSARTIVTRDCPTGWALAVTAESDEAHYANRPPPGAMLPATEEFIAEHQEDA